MYRRNADVPGHPLQLRPRGRQVRSAFGCGAAYRSATCPEWLEDAEPISRSGCRAPS